MKKTLKDRIRIIFKHFYIIVLLMILSGVLTYYVTYKIPSYYESKSIILAENNEEYNIETYKTYVKYLINNNILTDVKKSLNLEQSVENLRKNIKVTLINDTKLIEIRVKNSDLYISQDILNEIIKKFKEKIEGIYSELDIHIVEDTIVDKYTVIDTDKYLLYSLIISFVIGCVLVGMFANENVTIKNHEDLKKYLDLKSLGIIPDANDINFEKNRKRKNNVYNTKIKIINDSGSIISESYRMIRTNLDFLDLKVVNFTSTSVGEGKSETITNVAYSFAMIGKKVLLIDCDLRKPKVHKNFNLNRALGLSDILVYDRTDEYKDIIQEFKIKSSDYKIDILSSGSKVSNPSELLSSKRFEKLINNLKEEYDLILIDCPPVSLMTDAVIVSKISSGTAYVIEYDRINYSAIANCIEQLKDINTNILGGIITKVNIHKQKKLYGNKYEYYYNNYMS